MKNSIEQTDERPKRQPSPRTDLSRHRAPKVEEGMSLQLLLVRIEVLKA